MRNKKAPQVRAWGAFPWTTRAILAPRYGGDPGAVPQRKRRLAGEGSQSPQPEDVICVQRQNDSRASEDDIHAGRRSAAREPRPPRPSLRASGRYPGPRAVWARAVWAQAAGIGPRPNSVAAARRSSCGRHGWMTTRRVEFELELVTDLRLVHAGRPFPDLNSLLRLAVATWSSTSRSVSLARTHWHIFGGQPALIHDLLGKLPVEVRQNELVKCVIEFAVLAPTEPRSLLWKVIHVHDIGEHDRICPIGET